MKNLNFGTVLSKINETVGIVQVIKDYIPVKKAGKDFKAQCPFHPDKNPSLLISSSKYIFKCFPCGVGGHAIRFVMLFEKISYSEALKRIVQKYDLPIEIDHLSGPPKSEEEMQVAEITQAIHNFYQSELINPPSFLKKYLNSRFLIPAIVEKYELGWAPPEEQKLFHYLREKKFLTTQIVQTKLFNLQNDKYTDYFRNRIIFPLRNFEGDLVGFSGRITGASNQTKFLLSRENVIFQKSSVLFNLDQVQKRFPASKKVYLVEGFTDAITLTEAGLPTIAFLGTEIYSSHLEHLQKLFQEFIIVPDGDEAGINSALKNSLQMKKNNLNVQIWNHQSSLDPDELIRSNPQILDNHQTQIVSPIEFLLSQQKQVNSKKETDELRDKLAPFWVLADKIEQFWTEKFLKEKFNLPIDILFSVPKKTATESSFQKPSSRKLASSASFSLSYKDWEKYIIYLTIIDPSFRKQILIEDGCFATAEVQKNWEWMKKNQLFNSSQSWTEKSFLEQIFNPAQHSWFKILINSAQADKKREKLIWTIIHEDLIFKWKEERLKNNIKQNSAKIKQGDFDVIDEQTSIKKKLLKKNN